MSGRGVPAEQTVGAGHCPPVRAERENAAMGGRRLRRDPAAGRIALSRPVRENGWRPKMDNFFEIPPQVARQQASRGPASRRRALPGER